MLNGRLLTIDRRLPSNPEDTRTFEILNCQMVENDRRLLPSHPLKLKRILHQEKDIDILWIGLRRYERSKHNEPPNLASSVGQLVDSF